MWDHQEYLQDEVEIKILAIQNRIKSKRKIIFVGLLFILLILSVIIWLIVTNQRNKNVEIKTVSTGSSPEPPETSKLIGQTYDFYVVNRHIENRLPEKFSDSKASDKSVEQITLPQQKDEQIDVRDHVHEEHTNMSEKIEELEEKLHRFIGTANSAVDGIGNLTTKFNNLEYKVEKLLNLAKNFDFAINSTHSEFQTISENVNQTIRDFKVETSEKMSQMQQRTYTKFFQHTNKVEHLLQSFRANTSLEYDEMNKTLYSYQQSLIQQVTEKLTNKNTSQKNYTEDYKRKDYTNFKHETTNKILRLETRVNESLVNMNSFQTNRIAMDKMYLKNYVIEENGLLRNKIETLESDLHSSEQKSAAAMNLMQSNVFHQMADYGVRMNQSLRSWVEDSVKESKSRTDSLQLIVNQNLQQVAELQRQVNILDKESTANTADVNKYQIHLNELSRKLEGKADAGWLQTIGGYAYLVAKERTNWMAARKMCEDLHAHLAYAGLRMSSDMYRYIVAQIVRPLGKPLWIGLNDLSNENHWTWNDGTALARSDTHWKLGQPNNYKNQDCAEMDTSGLWGDLSCSGGVTAFALCEKKVIE